MLRCAVITIRYYAHFAEKEDSPPGDISCLQNCSPRFLQPPSVDQDELDAVLDAIYDESLAAERANAKASAASRKPDEPEPGSSAALPPQGAGCSSTKRPARNLGKMK